MKKYESPTVNGGRTIILDHFSEGVERGREYIDSTVDRLAREKGEKSIKVGYINRNCCCSNCNKPRADHHVIKNDEGTKYFCVEHVDGKKLITKKQFKESKGHETSITFGELLRQYKEMQDQFKACVDDIEKGDPAFKEKISDMAEDLKEFALDLAPSLRANYAGFNRSDDGFTVSPELLAAGEEQCCIRRKEGGESVKQGSGEGAYRIIINTDVEWRGLPEDNASMIGALVTLLQQFKPVEVWVQQGWTGEGFGDGVTMFKLDFTGAFDVTQLAFWCGNQNKDRVFSFLINKGLGRQQTHSATTAEIPCDLFLRGDWMKIQGIDEYEFMRMLYTDKLDIMAKWIAETAVRVAIHAE